MTLQYTLKRLKNIILFRYAAIGVLGVIADFSITWILREMLFFNSYLASSIGMSFAIVHNFAFHKYWTFTKKGGKFWKQFLRYTLGSVVVIIFNNLFVFFLSQYVNFYASKIIVIAFLALLNYFFCKTYIFQSTHK